MPSDLTDTIVAVSTAPGGARRALVRLSGAHALDIALAGFEPASGVDRSRRSWCSGEIHVKGITAPLAAELMYWPAPRTYTGQQMAELHTLSSPPLLDLLIAQLLSAGARSAQPGEFTLRAFLAGKLDLTRAEAVQAIVRSSSRSELQRALAQLAGGIASPLQELRSELLDLLADVEAGLDFADEDLQFVEPTQLLKRLARALAQLTILMRQLDRRGIDPTAYRVALAGSPNAGKSSLFNVLAGLPLALVSAAPGTTRDYLSRRVTLSDLQVELIDTPGWQFEPDAISVQAATLGRKQHEDADLVLLCVEAGRSLGIPEQDLLRRSDRDILVIATKCDLALPDDGHLATSAVTDQGIAELRSQIVAGAQAHQAPALAPSLARCRGHVDSCLQHLRRAHANVLEQDPPELLALALRETLEELGAMVGAVYTDDLLDRIFSRFCIGK